MSGLYLHVPFCSALCPYCDFAVVVGRATDHRPYAEALLTEARASGWPDPVDSVFIGGGTPSFVDPSLIASVLDGVGDLLDIASDAEVSMEANPETVDAGRARAWREAGVNRLSIGAQSFDDEVLTGLGRTHAAADIDRAVAGARAAGFDNISLDLIYGTEDLPGWRATLERAVALQPDHVSCYALTIEERTAFGRRVAAGSLAEPDQDLLAEEYHVAREVLGAAGLPQYEISNWGRPCEHNLSTWRQGDYLGLGIGAHSHRAGHRWWNTRSLSRYLVAPAAAREGQERLDDAQRAEEWLSLRLRLTEGFDRAEAEARLGRRLDVGGLRDLLDVDGDRIRLTERGMLLENEVALHLLGLSTRPPGVLT